MIRPFTCLCLLGAFGSGLYLYSEKHRTALLDREIGRVIHDTQAARDRTGMLRSEWAVLNEPGRLQAMAEKYLTLRTMAPTQFVQLAALSSRLPAAVANPPADSTDDDDAHDDATSLDAGAGAPTAAMADAVPGAAPGADLTAGDAAPSPQAEITAPAVVAAKPEVTQHAAASTKTPAKLARLDNRQRPQHHIALADRQDGLMQRGTPLPLASPQPVGASVFSAMARPMHVTAPRPAVIAAVPAYATASQYVGSSLGGRGTLPPPVPLGAGER